MGKSHKAGWNMLRGKRWYGYYRKQVIGPETETVRAVKVPIRLGLKSQMTKLAAREALRSEIAKQTSQIADGRILKDGSVTVEWSFAAAVFRFDRETGGPKRQGKTAQIDFDLISKFGASNLETIDKFELQTHVNHFARTYCQDRVKQARSYLKSIFDEAIEQESLVKDPTRTLKIRKNLRPKDKQILTGSRWVRFWRKPSGANN